MHTAVANLRMVQGPPEKAVSTVRRLLRDGGLSVVEEFNLPGEPHGCTVLLVDTPALLFESIALDRAAAVLLPIHVVISPGLEGSYVRWTNPMASCGLRPPAPAKVPLENLCLRLTRALSELPQVETRLRLTKF